MSTELPEVVTIILVEDNENDIYEAESVVKHLGKRSLGIRVINWLTTLGALGRVDLVVDEIMAVIDESPAGKVILLLDMNVRNASNEATRHSRWGRSTGSSSLPHCARRLGHSEKSRW